MDKTMRELKARFLELNKNLKEYGKNKCTFYRDKGICGHPAMGWGGIITDTGCRLDNCPFILYRKVE